MLPRIGIVHIVVLWDYVDLWRDGIHSSFDQEKLTKLRVLNYGQVPISLLLLYKGIPNHLYGIVFILLIKNFHELFSLCGTMINEREWRENGGRERDRIIQFQHENLWAGHCQIMHWERMVSLR